MPLKADAPATEYREIDRWDGGVGWIAHPDESMQRASHVLEADGEAWLVDPVDAPGVDELAAEFGEVAGVVVTLGRHQRDADRVARRHDVPVYAPHPVKRSFDAAVHRFRGALADTGFRAIPVVDVPGWREAALFDGETLVVGESVGTADYFVAGDERLGVHPMMRVFPPAALRGLAPERVLVGHGPGVTTDAARVLRYGLDSARRNAPAAWLAGLRGLVP
jgi:hypothetical protein